MDELERTGNAQHRGHGATHPHAGNPPPSSETEADPESILHHLRLPGRVLIQGFDEEACLLKWVRGTVARVEVETAADLLSFRRAVLYLDLIGRIEGMMSWKAPKQIDVAIEAPKAKWLRLRPQFAILSAMAPAERENVRGFRRIALNAPDVALWLTNGLTLQACVRDISRSGAAIRASILPEPGSIVTLGSTRGRVVRQFEDGFAVQFLRLLPLERFGPTYGL